MVNPVGGNGGSVGAAEEYFQRGPAQRDSDPSSFLSMMDRGLGTISQRPDLEPSADRMVDSLSGAYTGDVGEAKLGIVGGEAGRTERATQAGSETLENRVRNIYTELTHYQVAWKIAQNVQRDISQLLRGS